MAATQLASSNGAAAAVAALSPAVRARVVRGEPMSRHTSLRVGGPADWYIEAVSRDMLAEIASTAWRHAAPMTLLGEGTNVCVADAGIRGLVVRNACTDATIGAETRVDCGHNLMSLFVRTMQAGLSGLEFAVGIPGTVGGALVSNAGAYRANIADLVRSIEVVEHDRRMDVAPEWMEFSYRDSRLRRDASRPAVLLGVTLALQPARKTDVRVRAKGIQMQRILKQPWEPSAGSFFKNVNDRALAESLPNLPDAMKQAGVVPAAYLSDACGLKGTRIGGAAIAARHANFIVNMGGATAADIRAAAELLKRAVLERFGVRLEEEVMYIGDWDAAAHG